MKKIIRKLIIPLVLFLSLVTGCIENDIPYPRLVGEITAIEVEGQVGTPQIDNETFNVSIVLADDVAVDPKNIKLLRFEVSDGANVSPVLTEYIDLLAPLEYTLGTYPGQYYLWTIVGKQVIERYVDVENQAEPAFIDPINKIIRVNVVPEQQFSNINIIKAKLGPTGATILPDPSEIINFNVPRHFEVSYRDIKEKWTMQVVSVPVKNEAKADAWATKVFLSGTYTANQGEPGFEYKKTSDPDWIQVPSADIIKDGNDFSVEINGLTPGTEYSFHSVIGETIGGDIAFTTEQAAQMVNNTFDDWCKVGKEWYSNKSLDAADYFWDNGNKGANALGEKNPTSPESSHIISGKAARMSTTAVFGVFAAGSVYYGKFLETILSPKGARISFGRPFTSRPTQVKFHYDYKSGTIDKTGGNYVHLNGTRDNCHIYAILTDWDAPFEVNTTTNTFIDLNDPQIIAYGEFASDQTTNGYIEHIIDLEYRREGVKPKYLVFVASSCKYGDYFTGSMSSVLYLDEVELVY